MSAPKPEDDSDAQRLQALAHAAGLERVLENHRADLLAALLMVEKCRRDLGGAPLSPDEDPWPPMRPGIP